MFNKDLERDLENIRDSDTVEVIDEAMYYIVYLEGQNRRLEKIENRLNEINDGNLAGKETFLAEFKEFFDEAPTP